MNTLGLRHLAINVQDPQKSKEFYIRVLKMQLEWEPDAENIFLTSGGLDNLALHKAKGPLSGEHSRIDHFGFAVASLADVDAWHAWIKTQNVKIVQDLKTHRDGARSFYFADPDGIVIQLIFHPPIAQRASKST